MNAFMSASKQSGLNMLTIIKKFIKNSKFVKTIPFNRNQQPKHLESSMKSDNTLKRIVVLHVFQSGKKNNLHVTRCFCVIASHFE